MKSSIRLGAVVLGSVFLFSATVAFASDITLTLIPPDGDVSGPPGSTVGWGYAITNNTSNWLETLSLSAGSFIDGTPDLIFDFPTVAPDSSVTEGFSTTTTAPCSSPPCGLYEFTWDSNAPAGEVNTGTFTVSSEYLSGNPASPSSTDLGVAPDASADYSASAPSAVTATPELATLLLLLTGICGLILYKQRAFSRKSRPGSARL